jgi:formylglycine-generating enzyme required for sulfatase activity
MRTLVAVVLITLATAFPAHAQFSLPRAEIQLSIDCEGCPTMVTLPNGLRMSQAHVTRADFEVFAAETGYKRTTWGCAWNFPGIEQEKNQPAVCVSHVDAMAYLEWLSARAGVAYRLPTIEEYRYAASGGQVSNYWWGQDAGEGRANCTGCKTEYDGKGTSPAGAFQPNPYGLLDAVGNAWQWTSDCQDTDCKAYFLIGGGWTSPPADLRLTKTIWSDAPLPFQSYGLRVVADESP